MSFDNVPLPVPFLYVVDDVYSCVTPVVVVVVRVCRKYEEMSEHSSEIPEDTEALVNLQNYVKLVSVE